MPTGGPASPAQLPEPAANFPPEDIVALLEDAQHERDAREVVRRLLALTEECIAPRITTIAVPVSDLNALATIGALGFPHFTSTLTTSLQAGALLDLLSAPAIHTRDRDRITDLITTLSGTNDQRRSAMLAAIPEGCDVYFTALHAGTELRGTLLVAGEDLPDLDLLRRVCVLALRPEQTVTVFEPGGHSHTYTPTVPAASTAGQLTTPSIHLTQRQQEVLRLLADGCTNSDAARVLTVSVNTIRTHRRTLMKLLEAHNTAELLSRARTCGVLS